MKLEKCLKGIRRVARRALFWYAWLWFFIEAAHVLVATFGAHAGIDSLSALLEPYLGRYGWIAAWLGQTWQFVSSVSLVVIRQEAHRWFRVRRGRRSADRLMVAFMSSGITFLATLFVIDLLLPDVKLALPKSVIDAIEVLILIHAGSWVSRLLHPATRRAIRRNKWVKTLLKAIVQTALDMVLGKHKREGYHAQPRGSHSNKRRAA